MVLVVLSSNFIQGTNEVRRRFLASPFPSCNSHDKMHVGSAIAVNCAMQGQYMCKWANK
jgi:hypothetical protein